MENKRVWARRRAAVNRRMMRMSGSGMNMLWGEEEGGDGWDPGEQVGQERSE